MSATLRYDVSPRLVEAPAGLGALFAPFGPRRVLRWKGYGDSRGGLRDTPRGEAVTLAVNLPVQAGAAYRLAYELFGGPSRGDGVVNRSAAVLLKKLTLSLGLPTPMVPTWHKAAVSFGAYGPDETAFLKSLYAYPDDLTTWGVYADWLTDADGADRVRGDLIHGWLAPRPALKTKYGVPVLVRDRL